MEKQALILRDDANMRVNETPLAIALMRTAEPILLRYYIVFRLLENNRTLSREFIIADTLRIAEKLHSYFGFQSPEYTDERLVERFIDTLVSQEVLLEESGLVSCNINNSALLKRAKQVLTSGCIETVEQSLYPR
jgi:glycerol-3-phosphate O-acyltransferase